MAWSVVRAAAAWQFFAAETITRNMHEADAFTKSGLDAAESRLGRARALIPGNPDYLDLAGHLKQIRAYQPGVVGRAQRDLLESAARDHRAALATRPLWPYSWANLLSVKDRLGEIDAEFVQAIHQAAQAGPWEPRVQLALIRSGLRHWDQLRSPERALVRGTLADALRLQPREAFDIVRFYVRPDLVCDQDTGQPQIERWCAQMAGAA